VPVGSWSDAGLLAPSVVRLDKVATLRKSLVERRLGRLSEGDRRRVGEALRSLVDRMSAALEA